MKKILFCILTLVAFAGVFAQQQPVVAVTPFDAISGVSVTDANMITRVFFIRLGNTNRVSLVDRNQVDRILREHRFQTSDWSNAEKTAELGRALNSDWIVRGELEKFGTNILVTVQFYDIQTFRFMGGSDILLSNVNEAIDKMDPLVDKLTDTIASTVSRPSAARSQNSAPASRGNYSIGDTGPAGGIVFYDKGAYSDGWRYLEAAPPDTEFRAEWGAHRDDVIGTRTEIGSGIKNTELIVEHLYNKNRPENNRAAQLCENLFFGGVEDWFLPSRDELNLMFRNLKERRLGDFKDEQYWSSSQFSNRDAHAQEFRNGERRNNAKFDQKRVRAIRAF